MRAHDDVKTNPKSGPNFPSIEGALYRRKPSLFCFLTGGFNWGDSAPRGHWAVSGDIGGCRDWGCSRRRVGGDRCSTPCSAVLPQSPLSPRRDPGTGPVVKLLCIKRSWRPSASLWGTQCLPLGYGPERPLWGTPKSECPGRLLLSTRACSLTHLRISRRQMQADSSYYVCFSSLLIIWTFFFFFPDSVLKLQE